MNESWYVVAGGASQGPFDAAAMAAKVADGSVRPETQVCRVGAQAWSRADSDLSLGAMFAGSVTATPEPTWSIGYGMRLAKAWKGRCWGTLVLIVLVWTALVLPDQILSVAVQVMGANPELGPEQIAMLSGVSSIVSLLTGLLVTVPMMASLGVMGANAIAGTLRVSDLFLGYRRYFAVLGATMLWGMGYFVGVMMAFAPMLIIGALARPGVGAPSWVFPLALLIGVVALAAILIFTIRRMIRYGQAMSILCDPAHRSVGVFEAFAMSARALKGREGAVFGLQALIAILAALSVLLLGIGLLLIGFPLMICGFGAVYHALIRRLPEPTSTQASAGA